jgi:uncharacterized protein (TIGR00730 family)
VQFKNQPFWQNWTPYSNISYLFSWKAFGHEPVPFYFIAAMIKKATVYCASSQKVDPLYFEATRELARELTKNQIELIYGGGSIGLMGALANTVIELGGNITGIIPKFMIEVEWAHKEIKNMVIVDTMHERKKLMVENTDCVIALPGGCGTLEELMEVITMKRLGMFTGPIIIVNINHFYDPLVDLLENMIRGNFLRNEHRNMWTVVTNVENITDTILKAPKWEKSAIGFASIQ